LTAVHRPTTTAPHFRRKKKKIAYPCFYPHAFGLQRGPCYAIHSHAPEAWVLAFKYARMSIIAAQCCSITSARSLALGLNLTRSRCSPTSCYVLIESRARKRASSCRLSKVGNRTTDKSGGRSGIDHRHLAGSHGAQGRVNGARGLLPNSY